MTKDGHHCFFASKQDTMPMLRSRTLPLSSPVLKGKPPVPGFLFLLEVVQRGRVRSKVMMREADFQQEGLGMAQSYKKRVEWGGGKGQHVLAEQLGKSHALRCPLPLRSSALGLFLALKLLVGVKWFQPTINRIDR